MEHKDTQLGNVDAPLEDYLAQAARELEAATPSAPDRRYLTGRARLRSADLKRKASGWHPQLFRALGELALFLAIVAVVTVVTARYLRSTDAAHQQPPGPAMITPAWASTDGSVIEFTVPYASWDEVPDYGSPLYPHKAVSAAVDAWLAQHADLQSELPGLPLADVSMSFAKTDSSAPVARVQVSVALTDSDLVSDLDEFITRQTGYAAPVIDSRTVYYNSEYPDLYAAGIKVHIDDRTFDFPSAFTPDEAGAVVMMLGQRTYYSGHGGYEIGPRFGDCAVFKVETNSSFDLVLTTIAKEINAAPDVRYELRHSSAMFEPDPEDLAHPWRDPVLEIIREGRYAAWSSQQLKTQNESSLDVEFYRMRVWLVPEDRWQQLQERQQALIAKGRVVLPDLTDDDWRIIEENAKHFEERIGAEKLAEYGETALEKATDRYNDSRAMQIDFDTRMSPEFQTFTELSDEERARAEYLADQLRAVTKQWYSEHAVQVYETSPIAELNREVRTTGDVPVWLRVWVKCNDPVLVDDLRQKIEAVDGLIRPLEVKHFTSKTTVSNGSDAPPWQ